MTSTNPFWTSQARLFPRTRPGLPILGPTCGQEPLAQGRFSSKNPIKFPLILRAFTDREMVSLKTEIWLVKTFRLLLPATMFVILFWTIEAPPEWQNSLISSLGENARHVFFFLGLGVIAALYKFMGVYERKIFFESHRLKSPLLRRPEE